MKRWTMVFAAIVMVALTGGSAATQQADDQRALRSRVEEHFDVVPLTDGIALTPKTRRHDVRLIEISDGVIAINGVAVTGRELRDRIGDDSDLILRLSYLPADQRRALFVRADSARAGRRPAAEADESTPLRSRRSTGERVRVFGDIAVREDEEIGGQVVAVLGSVRVDGEVADQVVAVLGSVDLGPKAIVRGDVVSVGGRVRRATGAQVRGSVTEISLGDAGVHLSGPWFGPVTFFDGMQFGAVPRLLGSTFRLLLLALLAGIALLLARGSVEGSAQRVTGNPAKAILVGLVSEVLVVPVFVLTAVLLAVSIIGIPLLLLMPFAVLMLIVMALVGFSGTAYAVGQSARRRFGVGGQTPFFDVCFGLLIIVSPLLLGRMLALAEWPANPFAWALIGIGTLVEFLAWTGGFGAILINAFSSWRARRAMRSAPPVATA